MHKNNRVIVLFILFISHLSIAQSIEKKEKEHLTSQYILSNIFSSTPLYGNKPRFTLGYLIQLKERWIYGLELGYANYNFLSSESRKREGIDEGYKLFEIRPSINYIINPNGGVKPYLAAELFYISHQDVFINDTERLRNRRYINNGNLEGAIAYDKADFSRQKYGVNFNIGFLSEIVKRFGLNCNIGLGLRNRNIKYTNIINAAEINEPDDENFGTPIHLLETGNKLGLNLLFNVKLFYRIK